MALSFSISDIPEIFSDLTPIPQDDGPDPVCTIAYTQSFVTAHDYMRAVFQSGEMSERTFRLSSLCLEKNAANYTIWNYRRQCMEALGKDQDEDFVRADLDFTARLGGANPKSYQIFYHRQALLENVSMEHFGKLELDYTAEVLTADSKNYHAWTLRQWVVTKMNTEQTWAEELDFAGEMIKDDPRNNSAWNQRWFCCHRANQEPISEELARKEMDYAIESGAKIDPYNESPWRYMIGIMKEQIKVKPNPVLIDEFLKKTTDTQSVVSDAGHDPDKCSNLVSARIDLLEMKGDSSSLEAAIKLAKSLQEYDPIREKYWVYRAEQLAKKL